MGYKDGAKYQIKSIYFGKKGITIEVETVYEQLAKQDRVREQAKGMFRSELGRFLRMIKPENKGWQKIDVNAV
jgi:hypothetical protein